MATGIGIFHDVTGSASPIGCVNLFDAYGEQIFGLYWDRAAASMYDPVNIIGYKGQTGAISDWDTYLVYCHNRYYSPIFGRWLTRDPAGLDGGMNVYEFCDNNPVMESDPSGLDGDEDPVPWYISIIPIYGSIREARHSFVTGHPYWGLFNTGMAISDIFLIKTLAVAPAKIGLKLFTREGAELVSREGAVSAAKTVADKEGIAKLIGESDRGAFASWARRRGIVGPGEIAHHWAVRVNSEVGKLIPDVVKNQPWNILKITGDTIPGLGAREAHNALHGWGPTSLNAFERVLYGTPLWAKNLFVNGAAHGASLAGSP